MREVSNKTIMVMLLATLAISLGGTFISLNAVNDRLASAGFQPITGFALIPNGTTTLTVQTTSSIKFTQSTIDFGTGNVNTTGGFTNCTLSTLPGSYGDNSGCESFNELSNGFTIENDGNTNLTVELRSNVSSENFINSPGAVFRWNVTVNETGSCVNNSGTRSAVNPNTTDAACGGTGTNDCGAIFEEVTTSNKVICPSMLFDNTNDALNIDVNITVPFDAATGSKLAGLIVTGTREPTS